MFGKSEKCPKCGARVGRDWNYCSNCGYPLRERYDEIFNLEDFARKIEKEFEDFDRLFKMNFKIPRIKMPPSESSFSGISITIDSRTGMRPRIVVRTYGDMKKYEPEIKRKLGIDKSEGVEEIKEEKEYEVPKVTEEPEAKVNNLGDKFVIEIKLPDVEKEEDIKIQPLEQSLEIRAKAKDKLYFKLLPITGRIVRKRFDNGKLFIEIEKD